ncbi:hypothetical protein Tco_1003054 [Tanacetum coccineum]|uniref:Uncharacterized protein n=1 Tax=Tanacetum coccineum TaxID=301880 RepID=A0ABQ5F801_9ASTR
MLSLVWIKEIVCLNLCALHAKKCLFDANHDLCVVNYLSDVNARARAKSVKSIKKKEWKTTGKMFKNVGYIWVPTGRIFTLVGNKCPLTRFTSTKIVPPRKPVKSTVMKNIKPSSASQWRPRETKHVCSSSEPRIVEARTTNHLDKNRDSNVSISPCSSSVQCRSYKSYLGPLLKEKKGVRFSALYLKKKRNLLVYELSYQQLV